MQHPGQSRMFWNAIMQYAGRPAPGAMPSTAASSTFSCVCLLPLPPLEEKFNMLTDHPAEKFKMFTAEKCNTVNNIPSLNRSMQCWVH